MKQINIKYSPKIKKKQRKSSWTTTYWTVCRGCYSSSCAKSASGSSSAYSSSSTEASWYYKSCQIQWTFHEIGKRKSPVGIRHCRESTKHCTTWAINVTGRKKAYTYMRSCVLLSASENSIGSIPSPVYLQDKKYKRCWKKVLIADESPMQESASFVHGGELLRQSNQLRTKTIKSQATPIPMFYGIIPGLPLS